MTKTIVSLLGLGALMLSGASTRCESGPGLMLTPLSRYRAGFFDEGAAEIVAHDPATQRLFVVNAQAAQVDILDLSDPAQLNRIGGIDVTPYGAVANSVVVVGGWVAVAVENEVKTAPGKVVFFDANGVFQAEVPVGALPDSLAASPDGRYVVVANEGEPNDDYSVDPEGSVTVIDLKAPPVPVAAPVRPGFDARRGGGVVTASVAAIPPLLRRPFVAKTADFRAFNDAVLDPSIRIFGPGATVAQDIEPEYVTISADSKTAWVTCQENNAIATIDLATAKVVRLVGLGFKDHGRVDTRLSTFAFDPASMPSIGTTMGGQALFLGGFSGLTFEGIDPETGRYRFLTHTDRGPNAEPTGVLRPFLLPGFAPELVRFTLDRATGDLEITERIALQRAPGEPLTGLPNLVINESGSEPYNDETPVDLLGNVLPLDPLGADLEGIAPDSRDGSFWMVDEYRPAIYHFDASGVLLERLVPIGTAAAVGAEAGEFGEEILPAVLAQRRQNRGFEAVAYHESKVYCFVQSPLRNPVSTSNGALNGMRNVRLVEFNTTNRVARQFLYVMDNPNLGGAPNSRADKIGDMVSLGGGEFLVVERDDDAVPEDPLSTIEKKVYRFNLLGATEISGFTDTVGTTGKTVDQLTLEELAANGIRPVAKVLEIDLAAAGYNTVQKVEGLAVIDPWTLAVINDNDFGVANITVDPADGTFVVNAPAEPVTLGILDLYGNGLDASDRDSRINIRPWPVKGMYLPDGIASYQMGGETFLVTANEGDVREYDGFEEALRIGNNGVVLDPVAFPYGAQLKVNPNLGRLTITTTLGRDPATGMYRELYTFGTRSFSIWDSQGALVFDSGDDLEWITAIEVPEHFNASNTNNDFDNRSDDKGPEPEGVVVGRIGERTFAFIGLERVGGIVVYDVTDPYAPVYVTYANPRNFGEDPETDAAGDLGPEGLAFIPAAKSPTGQPLLVVGNEVSGTTTVYSITLLP